MVSKLRALGRTEVRILPSNLAAVWLELTSTWGAVRRRRHRERDATRPGGIHSRRSVRGPHQAGQGRRPAARTAYCGPSQAGGVVERAEELGGNVSGGVRSEVGLREGGEHLIYVVCCWK